MNEELLRKVREYVEEIFRNNTHPENCYHNLVHTKEVVSAAREIAHAEKIDEEDEELILIAAWFHDSGCVDDCKGHEVISSKFAQSFLKSLNYPEEKINKIISLIKATKVPQKPKNILEEVLCDADLHHLGTEEFKEKGDLLRMEFEKRGEATFSEEKWLHHSLEFMKNHKFFTKTAREKYGVQRKNNLGKIEEKIKELKELKN